MSAIEEAAKTLGIPVARFRRDMAHLGLAKLMNEAARLQAIEAWDKGPEAVKANLWRKDIDANFGLVAYQNLCQTDAEARP